MSVLLVSCSKDSEKTEKEVELNYWCGYWNEEDKYPI